MASISKINPVYFIYTHNNIPGIGGTTPQGVSVGIGNYKNIYSGRADDSLLLLSIAEFNPVTVTKDEALGLNLIGLTSVVTGLTPPRKLTSSELTQQKAAVALIRKLRIRFEIQSNIGDSGDLIADLSKRVALLERMVMHYLDSTLNTTPIPTTLLTEYKSVITSYVSGVTSGAIKDSIDLESRTDLITKLTARYNKIADIVATTK